MNDNNSSLEIFRALCTSTFDYVGKEFLERLASSLTQYTKSDCCLLLQLVSPEEYKELTSVYKDELHTLSTCTTAPSPEHSPASDEDEGYCQTGQFQDHYLFVRAFHHSEYTYQPNTMIPVSCLDNSAFLKSLLSEENIVIQQAQVEQNEFHPAYNEYIGLRLQQDTTTFGFLCILNKEVMDTAQLDLTTTLLKTIQARVINELKQLGKADQLIFTRDLALLDAENKLKFLADMSHEIRTPMNAVIALTDLLLQERSTLNVEQIEHLEVIQTSGSHLLTIINDILDISKLNHDPKFKLENRRFSLRKCLKDTLNMARHQASMSQQNKIVYVLECPPDKDDNLPLPQLISQLENNGVLLRPLLQRKGKTVLPVIWKIDPDVPDHLLGDTMRLTQIMLNLCSNAVKFTKEGGIHIRIKRSVPTPVRPALHNSDRRMTFKERHEAKIETMWNRALQEKNQRNPLSPSAQPEEDPNEYQGEKSILEISVTDTGIGIPADRLPKLFKSFSQIDISTARRYGGTGLGLAISSTLVNRMGGCVWVESEEGVGSRFALTLPMTVAPRGRNYSSDSTPAGFVGSPSSPSSTISDSSSSVHSTLGNDRFNEITSPLSMYTFTTPTVNNTPNNPGYFPLTMSPNAPMNPTSSSAAATPNNTINTTNFAQGIQRPVMPRTSQQNNFSTENRTENLQLPSSSDPIFSPMLEAPALPNRESVAEAAASLIESKKQSSGSNGNGSGTSSSRKMYNDLLSPVTRNSRVGINKQHYRKPANKEENLAKQHPLRILLAEDNILNQKIAISILKRLGYTDVVIANNGREVLSHMRTCAFDVIFMDLYMPEMDGLEVTREIIKERKMNKEETTLMNSSDVYIIALTASASREDRQICIDAGMNDFISKPFTMTEMRSALKTCATCRKKRRKLQQQDEPIIPEDDPMVDIEMPLSHV